MRFSFIMGGIVGAALTIYLTRNQNTELHQKVEQVGNKMKSTFDTASFLMKEVVFAGNNNNNTQAQETSSSSSSERKDKQNQSNDDLSQLEELAKQDPEAKKEMDKILQSTH